MTQLDSIYDGLDSINAELNTINNELNSINNEINSINNELNAINDLFRASLPHPAAASLTSTKLLVIRCWYFFCITLSVISCLMIKQHNNTWPSSKWNAHSFFVLWKRLFDMFSFKSISCRKPINTKNYKLWQETSSSLSLKPRNRANGFKRFFSTPSNFQTFITFDLTLKNADCIKDNHAAVWDCPLYLSHKPLSRVNPLTTCMKQQIHWRGPIVFVYS